MFNFLRRYNHRPKELPQGSFGAYLSGLGYIAEGFETIFSFGRFPLRSTLVPPRTDREALLEDWKAIARDIDSALVKLGYQNPTISDQLSRFSGSDASPDQISKEIIRLLGEYLGTRQDLL